MFGNFFNTAEVDKFADWIVEELKRLLPPGFDPDKDSVGRRAEKLNERIAKRTAEFTQQTSLNIYKKARLAARVREGMSTSGYPATFVKSFSYDLLARLQMAASQPKR
jgi:cell division septum initiation protein DivIVA